MQAAGELGKVLELVANVSDGELPDVIGLLARAQALALARLSIPKPLPVVPAEERLRCLTVQEAAEILAVPDTRVYELVRKKKLRAVHVGKYVRIPLDALDEFRNRRG